MIRAEILGDINVTIKLIQDLADLAESSMVASLKYYGMLTVRETKDAMRKQSIRWKALSIHHAKYKKKNRYDKRIYMMTKSLYKSVHYDMGSTGHSNRSLNHKVSIGFPNTAHPVTGEQLSVIAKRMEKGDKKKGLPQRRLLKVTSARAWDKYKVSSKTPKKIFEPKAKLLVRNASRRIRTRPFNAQT